MLRRAAGVRAAGAWEVVHGHIEAGESPVQAALRELGEETGLVPDRFYNLSRVESFYLHATDVVALIPVFAAVVSDRTAVTLSSEHDAERWVPIGEAATIVAWPRERRALLDLEVMLPGGEAGPLEPILRVPLG